MASFLTAARFEKSNKKLWTVLERLEVINALFPTEGADPELGVEMAISKLTQLNKHPAEGSGTAANCVNTTDSDEDGNSENDPEDTARITMAIREYLRRKQVNWVSISPVMIAAAKRRSADSIKADSEQRKCSRHSCKDPSFCYVYRRKQHAKGTSLYHLILCGVREGKPMKKKASKTGSKEKRPNTTGSSTFTRLFSSFHPFH